MIYWSFVTPNFELVESYSSISSHVKEDCDKKNLIESRPLDYINISKPLLIVNL